jgi:hypothetical protein
VAARSSAVSAPGRPEEQAYHSDHGENEHRGSAVPALASACILNDVGVDVPGRRTWKGRCGERRKRHNVIV